MGAVQGLVQQLVEDGITVWCPAAVGGGSLVYNTVLLQPTRENFERVFPPSVDYDEMDQVFYPRVIEQLKAGQIPDDVLKTDHYLSTRVFMEQGEKAGLTVKRVDLGSDWDVVRQEIRGEKKPSAIAGEIWMGSLTVLGTSSVGAAVPWPRVKNETLRAQVFARDRFRCTACGGRAVPRCILVAVHDLFPEQLVYDPHYKRGYIHPVFWALAPEADHVVPHSQGGQNTLENLTTLHASCNTQKSDGVIHRSPTRSREGDSWEGLVASYPALITAGAGDARPKYHREWSRRYLKVLSG